MSSLKVHIGNFSLISLNFLISLMGLPWTTYYFVYVLFSGQVVKVKAVYVKWAAFLLVDLVVAAAASLALIRPRATWTRQLPTN